MADKDPKSPATTSAAYDEMAPRWHVMEALLGGTETMRAAGETYLPKNEEETDNAYQTRLQATVLLNSTEQTLETLASKPFSEPVQLEDVPTEIEDLLEDVDMLGNNLDVFTRQWFREGLAKGFAHVLVDMPRVSKRADGQPRTLADDRAENVRPYWVFIKPEFLLFARAVTIGGKEVLQHVRILECYTEQDGFAEVHKKRIKVIEPGTVTTYIPKPRKSAGDKEEWIVEETWETELEEITLVTFYAQREGLMCSKPPLQDLAWLNVSHWQSLSMQKNVLRVARFPILACSGATADDSDPITIGPNKVLYNDDPHGKFYYVEHTGAAITAGQTDLEAIEAQMSSYGGTLLEEDPGNPTATAKAIDTSEETSSLSSMALKFEDAVAQALAYTAQYLKIKGEDVAGEVSVVKDYTQPGDEAPGLTALQAARTTRDISRQAYLKGLMDRGVLPEDFDIDADEELIQGEASDMMAAASQFELNPGAPLPGPGQGLPTLRPPEPDDETGKPAKTPAAKPASKKRVAKKGAARKTTKKG